MQDLTKKKKEEPGSKKEGAGFDLNEEGTGTLFYGPIMKGSANPQGKRSKAGGYQSECRYNPHGEWDRLESS